MANWCQYNLKIVGITTESVERFYNILRYCDPEYRVYDNWDVKKLDYKNQSQSNFNLIDPDYGNKNYHVLYLDGFVKWAIDGWIYDKEDLTSLAHPRKLDENGNFIMEKRISDIDKQEHEYYVVNETIQNHYSNFLVVCNSLNVGVEAFGFEPNNHVSQKFIVNHFGALCQLSNNVPQFNKYHKCDMIYHGGKKRIDLNTRKEK